MGSAPRNVCKAVTPPKPSPEEIRPLDAEDAKRFLHAANGDRLEALYVLAVTAGLRVGELLGLKWEDLDQETNVLRVRRTRSQAKTGPTFTTPKSGKGRSIRLTRQAVEAPRVHKAPKTPSGSGSGNCGRITVWSFAPTAVSPWTSATSPRPLSSRSSRGRTCRISGSTICATHVPLCCSRVATIPISCKSC